MLNLVALLLIIVPDEKTRSRAKRRRFAQLLCHPGIRRMACHIDMHHPPRLQLDDHEDQDTAEEGIIRLQEITRPDL
jgi:hypothetical protein